MRSTYYATRGFFAARLFVLEAKVCWLQRVRNVYLNPGHAVRFCAAHQMRVGDAYAPIGCCYVFVY